MAFPLMVVEAVVICIVERDSQCHIFHTMSICTVRANYE